MLNLITPEMQQVSFDFRKLALIVILLRAGFELGKDTLHRVGGAALTMSALPAVFEMAGIMWIAHGLLGMSLLDTAILGAMWPQYPRQWWFP